jgi:aryl-alcohol dehydrogenase
MSVLRAKPGQSIAVFGLGAVGLSALMAANALGCTPIIAIDPNPERLNLATELGATHTLDPSAIDDIVWAVTDISANGVDFSVDAVGLESVVQQALGVLRSPGICATLGLQGLENEVRIDQGHLLLGRTLTGVIEGDVDPHQFIPQLVDLWKNGQFPFDKLIETYTLPQINEALAAAAAGSVIKPVIVFD